MAGTTVPCLVGFAHTVSLAWDAAPVFRPDVPLKTIFCTTVRSHVSDRMGRVLGPRMDVDGVPRDHTSGRPIRLGPQAVVVPLTTNAWAGMVTLPVRQIRCWPR